MNSVSKDLEILYETLLKNYPKGISNTSISKFNDFAKYFSDLFKINTDDIYIVGAGTRTTNLPIRFSQGAQSTKRTKLGIGLVISNGKSLNDITNSASKTLTNYAKKERTLYDSILLIIIENNIPIVTRLFNYVGSSFDSIFSANFPNADIRNVDISTSALNKDNLQNISNSIGINRIYYGSPGTGKSTLVKRFVGESMLFRTQFHPEYTYTDFVGGYRPVVGSETDENDNIIAYDNSIIRRPVNYFDYVPGPFIQAIEYAYLSGASVFLIIEEINRGDCAGIFGDIFQLLDRDESGNSEFGVTVSPELNRYISSRNIDVLDDDLLLIPSNLSIIATMNTSDQSLFPMDSAFKRRWEWKACPIIYDDLLSYTNNVPPYLNDGYTKWNWIDLLTNINKYIVNDHMEDKQIGPWFIKPQKDGTVSWDIFLNKCLFYLWHDVFKDEQLTDLSVFRSDGPNTFSELQNILLSKGLSSGLKEEILRTDGNIE